MSDRKHLRLGLIGFGEVGSTLGKGFKAKGCARSQATTSMLSMARLPS